MCPQGLQVPVLKAEALVLVPAVPSYSTAEHSPATARAPSVQTVRTTLTLHQEINLAYLDLGPASQVSCLELK